jgi:hypothetical protein
MPTDPLESFRRHKNEQERHEAEQERQAEEAVRGYVPPVIDLSEAWRRLAARRYYINPPILHSGRYRAANASFAANVVVVAKCLESEGRLGELEQLKGQTAVRDQAISLLVSAAGSFTASDVGRCLDQIEVEDHLFLEGVVNELQQDLRYQILPAQRPTERADGTQPLVAGPQAPPLNTSPPADAPGGLAGGAPGHGSFSAGPVRPQGGRIHPRQEARDKWLYTQLKKAQRPTLQALRERLKRKRGEQSPRHRWRGIGTTEGVRRALKRYAKRHALPYPRRKAEDRRDRAPRSQTSPPPCWA